jgi:transcriptional regulator, XRE family
MPRHNAYDSLCSALVRARLANELTQINVATALGRPQSFVSKYESGERTLDVIEFIQICQVIGVSPTALISELQVEL